MKHTFLFLIVFLGQSIWGMKAYPMAAWDNQNDPRLFSLKYERSFEKLPLKGKLSKLPWSGDYWPTYKGGITYRWKADVGEEDRWNYPLSKGLNFEGYDLSFLSPAEKYDLFVGDLGFSLTRYERERTGIMKTLPQSEHYDKSFSIPEWEGLCHAWAPATYLYDNPAPVTVKGALGHQISFGSSDIKALLVYFLHLEGDSMKTQYLGGRCHLDFDGLKTQLEKEEISLDEFKEQLNSKNCKDTNAGAFHIALANEISLKDKSFVVDITRDAEVWNQPVVGYSSKILETSDKPSEGASPEAVKEVLVKTVMEYIEEVKQSFEKRKSPESVVRQTYVYTLELDKDGRIVGGEWKSFDRPDFIWKVRRPKFKGFFQDLEKIYKKSTEL